MLRLTQITVLIGAIVVTSAAQAGPKTLAECYDIVIAHCNTTAHPVPCSTSGMDQCDKEFKAIVVPPPTRGPAFKTR